MMAIAILSACVFVSCSDDDDNDINKSKIVGTWECVAYEEWLKEDGEITEREDPKRYIGRYITINAAGTYTGNFYGDYYADHGDWRWKGNELWGYDSDGGEPIVYGAVIQLDNNSLVFEASESAREDGIRYEYYSKVSFKRVADK